MFEHSLLNSQKTHRLRIISAYFS